MMQPSIISTVILITSLFAVASYALRCYSCEGTKSQEKGCFKYPEEKHLVTCSRANAIDPDDCNDMLYRINGTKSRSRNHVSTQNEVVEYSCYKIYYGGEEGEEQVWRACAIGFAKGCIHRQWKEEYNTNRESNAECFCIGNQCNGVASFVSSFGMVLCGLFALRYATV